MGLLSCKPSPSAAPQSIFLFVMDTTRVDAVSAYGPVRGTTPATDALAARGLRFDRAYAQAPWTLPSHASLFTGLLPSEHGVSWRNTRASDRLEMLAERLRNAGYDTYGFSENAWISGEFNMTQGFDAFSFHGLVEGQSLPLDTVIRTWMSERTSGRPFFLFVNVVDPHWPYTVRNENPYLPEGVTAEEARSVPQTFAHYLCRKEPRTQELAILQGLYRGDVAAADAKLAQVLDILEGAGVSKNTVTIVTSDHGEHFGEHGLFGHEFGVRSPLVHVPLIVHGLRGTAPDVIDEPVALTDVVPSVLTWAGLDIPEGLPGRPLPTAAHRNFEPRAIASEYDDPGRVGAAAESPLAARLRNWVVQHRAQCSKDWPVFGDMRSLVRLPFKLIWFESYPPELYDLAENHGEERNLAQQEPQLTAELMAELDRVVQVAEVVRDRRAEPSPTDQPEVSENIVESLKALGYLDD